MNAKALKEILKTVPDNYEVDFSKIYILKGEEDVYECVLDNSISGIVTDEKNRQFRFVIEYDEIKNTKLGKITKIQ